MRNAFPPIRIFRRWIGLDPVPVIEKLDKTESHLEKIKKDHEENIDGLLAKLEKLQDQQTTKWGGKRWLNAIWLNIVLKNPVKLT